MTVPRLVAIAVILALATGAWMILVGSVEYRTSSSRSDLTERVEGLWGGPQAQQAPTFTYTSATITRPRALHLAGSDISADLALDQRRKGLLWYATYAVDFAGTYRVSNPESSTIDVTMAFTFPVYDGVYDGFAVTVNGQEVPVSYDQGVAQASFPVGAGQTASVGCDYRTQGLDEWRYVPTVGGVALVDDFVLEIATDFTDVDYPADAVSPTDSERSGDGMVLRWEYASLVTGRPIALTMPRPTDPGPLASRITAFAPVALLFYFAALVLLTATSGLRLHPVNYGFLAAGFFAFHLLFAYLVDHLDVGLSFAIASVTSVALCVGYLALAIGRGRVLRELALSQLVFLVLFSYSFFFEGFTGLAVTIGSVLTLAYFMLKTARVDWAATFARPHGGAVTPAGPDVLAAAAAAGRAVSDTDATPAG